MGNLLPYADGMANSHLILTRCTISLNELLDALVFPMVR
jgi:hypothetical protein